MNLPANFHPALIRHYELLCLWNPKLNLVSKRSLDEAFDDPVPIVAVVSLVQFRNARTPMLVTLPGIVTLVRLLQE